MRTFRNIFILKLRSTETVRLKQQLVLNWNSTSLTSFHMKFFHFLLRLEDLFRKVTLLSSVLLRGVDLCPLFVLDKLLSPDIEDVRIWSAFEFVGAAKEGLVVVAAGLDNTNAKDGDNASWAGKLRVALCDKRGFLALLTFVIAAPDVAISFDVQGHRVTSTCSKLCDYFLSEKADFSWGVKRLKFFKT